MEKCCENISLLTPDGKRVRLANFCLMTCHKVVFTSELYFDMLTNEQSTQCGQEEHRGMFAGFKYILPPSTLQIVNAGVNPRKYLHLANRGLSDLLSDELGDDETEWLTHMHLLK
jgi:glucan phosphorylase